jgi:negative regulator of sigma E activity
MRFLLLSGLFLWALGGAQERPVQWLQRAQQAESSLAVAGVRITEIRLGRSTQRIEERFWRQGARAERIEILAPPARRGEMLIFRGGRWVAFRPEQKEAFELPPMPLQGAQLLQKAVELTQLGILQTDPLTEATLLGRECVVVRLRLARPNPPHSKPEGKSEEKRPPFPASVSLWIDKDTGLVLKSELAMRPNAPALRTEITRLELNPRLTPDLFTLPSGVVVRPLGGEYKTIEEAQRAVSFTIRTPSYLPQGATLERVLVRRRPPDNVPVVILHYQASGARFSVFQSQRKGNAEFPRPERRPGRPNVYFWQDGDYMFGVVGSLPQSEIERIAKSLSRAGL